MWAAGEVGDVSRHVPSCTDPGSRGRTAPCLLAALLSRLWCGKVRGAQSEALATHGTELLVAC